MPDDRSIQPDGLYSTDEVAEILGYRSNAKDAKKVNRNRVYEIPYELLHRTKIGAKGGRVMYRGRHILEYLDRCCQTRKTA